MSLGRVFDEYGFSLGMVLRKGLQTLRKTSEQESKSSHDCLLTKQRKEAFRLLLIF